MSNRIEYKGYWSNVEYSAEDGILHGVIEGIADYVDFECESASGTEAAFQEAVEDYLAFCADMGQEPNKPYKGSFNVRVNPALHRNLDFEAKKQGTSMNQLIESVLTDYISNQHKQTTESVQWNASIGYQEIPNSNVRYISDYTNVALRN